MDIIGKLLSQELSKKTWYFPAENKELSIAELIDQIKKYATVLTSLGVTKGDRIGLINNNSSELICIIYACWYINAVAVPLRTQTGKFQRFESYVQRCDEVCNFKLLILDDDVSSDGFEEWAVKNSKPAYVVSYLNQINAATNIESVKISCDDLAIIQFSSGSTGQPKGVMVNHGMVMAQLENLAELFTRPIGGTDVECYALWAPVNHDMGMFVGVLTPIYQNTNNILAPPSYFMRNPVRWFKLLAERKVEVAMFTNSVLSKCLPAVEKKLHTAPIDLSRCRFYLGAEKVSPIVIKEAYRVLEPLVGSRNNLYIGYGMAENSLGMTTTLTGEIPLLRVNFLADNRVDILDKSSKLGNELASIGVPYANQRVTVRNRADEVLPELMLGEIHVESHCLSPGYYNNPDKTSEAFCGRRFKTKDLGFWYLGQLYYFSREDDLIILNGQNIIPDDIEFLIEELSFVRASTSVLFATEDADTGLQKICALVEINNNVSVEDAEQRANEILGHVYAEVGIIINKVSFCEKGSVEKTSSGKKRRQIIKQRFVNGQIEIIKRKDEHELHAAV